MNPNKPKEDRNKQIYQDRVSGMSYRQLMMKYDLSLGRLQNIVDREAGREPTAVVSTEILPTQTYEPAYVLQKLQMHVRRILERLPGVTFDQFTSDWVLGDGIL